MCANAHREQGKADTAAALAKIHDCVKRLRDALDKYDPLHPNRSAGETAVPEKPKRSQELEARSQQMLAVAVAASMAHDSIIRSVSASRDDVSDDQEALLNVRLKLDNLSHEKRVLQQQIESCRNVKSGLLDQLDVELPVVNTESDESTSNTHKAITAALNDELAKRKRMHQLVESVVQNTSTKRRKLAESKTELRELPRAVRSLAPSLDPIRNLFSADETVIGLPNHSSQILDLPGPLYILCRTASAYQETFGGLEVLAVGEPVTEKKGLDSQKSKDPYFIHPMMARIDVLRENRDPRLRVVFRYHPNLRIVTVTSTIVVDGQEAPSYPTKELQMLYPWDLGELSPNPCNEFKEQGSFEFDVTKAKGGRPYIWANIICGIPCLPRINASQGLSGGPYLDWPNVAAQQPDHLRFKDVVQTLRERLRTIVSLNRQIEALASKKLPVLSFSTEKPKDPEARVDDFVKISPQDVVRDEQLGRLGTEGRYTEVWAMVVSRGDLKINCMIGLEPDYPVGPPVFRLKCKSTVTNLTEKDIVELERCVNEYQPQGGMVQHQDLLLGGQIRALLTYVDNLVAVCESIDEGTVESGSGEIKGRTRSKRHAILGRQNN